MEYDFLNIRAIFTESSEGSTTGVLEMYTLEEGNTKDKIQHFQVFNFNKADQEFKQFIIEKIYPVPAVQPPEGSPERNFGNNTQYKHQRKAAYPEIGEQLDMLYKDMLEGSSSFIEAITNIKNSIPKSENIERPPLGMSEAYKQERLNIWNEAYGFNLSLEEFYGI